MYQISILNIKGCIYLNICTYILHTILDESKIIRFSEALLSILGVVISPCISFYTDNLPPPHSETPFLFLQFPPSYHLYPATSSSSLQPHHDPFLLSVSMVTQVIYTYLRIWDDMTSFPLGLGYLPQSNLF